MSKRYYIELSMKDRALVSYFPGLEIKDDELDGFDHVLVDAIWPLKKRKSAKIRETPITFWVSVRGTARRWAEVFIFMTPAYPGAVIEKAMVEALQPIKDVNAHAGREPIPEDAVPYLQVFRGKIFYFYGTMDGYEGFYKPEVWWNRNNDAPELKLIDWNEDELITVDDPIEQIDHMIPVEARILPLYVSNGKECRKFQQALIPVARVAE
jgi:hypothetical protein